MRGCADGPASGPAPSARRGAAWADSAAEIAVNRAYTHQVAWEFDRGGDRKTLHAKAAMVKLSASEASNRIADRCMQILGGRGYMREQPIERLWRELRVDRIWEGTSEIQRLVIANELDKRGTGFLAFAPAEERAPVG
jgi:acyl-CoA dehydrogenase